MGPGRVLVLLALFAAELTNLWSVAYAALGTTSSSLRWPAAITLPLLLAVLWGTFAAPKAAHRLRGAKLKVFVGAWYACGVVGLVVSGHPSWALAFVVALVLLAVAPKPDRDEIAALGEGTRPDAVRDGVSTTPGAGRRPARPSVRPPGRPRPAAPPPPTDTPPSRPAGRRRGGYQARRGRPRRGRR